MDLSSFQCIEMAVFNSATFSGGSTFDLLNGPSQYQYYTGSGFEDDIKILKVYNASNVGVIVCYQPIVVDVMGTPTLVYKRQDYWPAGSTLILDLQTNHADTSSYGSGTLYGRKGQLIYGNASAGSGSIYISGYR